MREPTSCAIGAAAQNLETSATQQACFWSSNVKRGRCRNGEHVNSTPLHGKRSTAYHRHRPSRSDHASSSSGAGRYKPTAYVDEGNVSTCTERTASHKFLPEQRSINAAMIWRCRRIRRTRTNDLLGARRRLRAPHRTLSSMLCRDGTEQDGCFWGYELRKQPKRI
jgi:hypothetical protein